MNLFLLTTDILKSSTGKIMDIFMQKCKLSSVKQLWLIVWIWIVVVVPHANGIRRKTGNFSSPPKTLLSSACCCCFRNSFTLEWYMWTALYIQLHAIQFVCGVYYKTVDLIVTLKFKLLYTNFFLLPLSVVCDSR